MQLGLISTNYHTKTVKGDFLALPSRNPAPTPVGVILSMYVPAMPLHFGRCRSSDDQVGQSLEARTGNPALDKLWPSRSRPTRNDHKSSEFLNFSGAKLD